MWNLHRIFYQTRYEGKAKAEVAVDILKAINSEMEVVPYGTDLLTSSFEQKLESIIFSVNLVLMGLGNIPAGEYNNLKAIRTLTSLVDVGALRSAGLLSGTLVLQEYSRSEAKLITVKGNEQVATTLSMKSGISTPLSPSLIPFQA